MGVKQQCLAEPCGCKIVMNSGLYSGFTWGQKINTSPTSYLTPLGLLANTLFSNCFLLALQKWLCYAMQHRIRFRARILTTCLQTVVPPRFLCKGTWAPRFSVLNVIFSSHLVSLDNFLGFLPRTNNANARLLGVKKYLSSPPHSPRT